jgi:hypothetical protein
MSFILDHGGPDLQRAIVEASKKIVIFCSTADQDYGPPIQFPASYGETLSIAARDNAPATETFSPDGTATYVFEGKDVMVDPIEYISQHDNSPHRISGSSVATAIAAGVGSLVLACDHYVNGNSLHYDMGEPISRRSIVTAMFEKMKGEYRDTKFVQPALLFSGRAFSGMDKQDGALWLKSHFSHED